MTPHLWQLRADIRPLEEGARQWERLSGELATTADDIVAAARHALDEGWESEAAESFEEHRRRMVQQIDTFTTVAARIGSSLTALAGLLTTAQQELDRAWAPVAVVPHDLVGSAQVLVLRPATPADEELVRSATDAAKAIRGRLDLELEAESTRLRGARMEIGTVRTELVQIVGGVWPVGVVSEVGDLGERLADPGRSTMSDLVGRGGGLAGGSTSVAGAPAGGAGGGASAGAVAAAPDLPALTPVSFSAPDLTGLSAAALAAGTGLAAGAAARRGRKQEPQASTGAAGMTPMGGMAAGAAMRGGSMGGSGGSAGSRGVGGSGGSASTGRTGGSTAPRAAKPLRPDQETAADRAARLDPEKEAAREAKRRLVAERQAERAARRAQREASRNLPPPAVAAEAQVAPDEDAPRRR